MPGRKKLTEEFASRAGRGRTLLGGDQTTPRVSLAQKERAARNLMASAKRRGKTMTMGEALRKIDKAAQEREFNRRKRMKKES